MLKLLTLSDYPLAPVVPEEEVVANEKLRRLTQQVTSIDEALPVVAGMKEWAGSHQLAGLSAPQFGISLRISFVWYQGLQIVMINPEVISVKGEVTVLERCLSLPGRAYWVKRPKIAKVRFLDETWQPHSLKGHDMTAQIIMHELDHLDGILIDAGVRARS